MGWEDYSNGRLLAAAADAGFEVMLTVDKSIRYQQNTDLLPLTVVLMNARSGRLDDLRAIAPFVLQAMEDVAQYRCIVVHAGGLIERFAPRE